MKTESQFFECCEKIPIVISIPKHRDCDFIDDGRVIITNTPTSIKNHLKQLSKASTEREIEAGIRAILSLMSDIKILPPNNNHSDGGFKYKKREGLFECKNPRFDLRNIKSYIEVVAQCLCNLHEAYINNGYVPDTISGWTNRYYFVISSTILLPYLSKDYDWSIQHSNAKNYERMMFDLMNDKNLVKDGSLVFRPIYFDENTFSIDQFKELITKSNIDYDDINSPFSQCSSANDYKKLLEEDYKKGTINFLSKRENYLKKPEIVFGVWGKGNKSTAFQDIHTPFSMCSDIINKLIEISGKITGKKFFVYNVEFLDYMYLCDILKNNEVFLITENRSKIEFAKIVYGDKIKCLYVTNFLEFEKDMKFDVELGNPPFNPPRGKSSNGSSIWEDFVKKSLIHLNDGGYLGYIHPPAWRSLGQKKWKELWPLLTKNQIHYLEIHSLSDGQKQFNCNVRYDWYILQKTKPIKETIILDELGQTNNVNLALKTWLPNFDFDACEKLLASNGNNCQIIHSDDYRTDKPWMSNTKTDVFIYPITHRIIDEKHGYIYSSENRGHFGISKVICSCSGKLYPFNDYQGKFGMCKSCFGIPISSKEEGDKMVQALSTEKCQRFVNSVKISGYYVNYEIFNNLKENFWMEFLNE